MFSKKVEFQQDVCSMCKVIIPPDHNVCDRCRPIKQMRNEIMQLREITKDLKKENDYLKSRVNDLEIANKEQLDTKK